MKKTCIILLMIIAFVGVCFLYKKDSFEKDICKTWYVTYDDNMYWLKFYNNELTSSYGDSYQYSINKNSLIINGEKNDYRLDDNKLYLYGMTFYDNASESISNNITEALINNNMEYDTSMFTSIESYELINKFNNKEDFFFIVARDDCYYCRIFRPTVARTINEYNYKLYYLDGNSEIDYNALSKIDEGLYSIPTPTVYHVVNGQIIDENDGAVFYLKYLDFLRRNNVYKK